MLKLMLDPGHGGKDPGAVANGLQEKNLVLTICQQIKSILLHEYEGVTVKLTRETDVFHELSTRAKMANDWGADYFMSIHVNAGGGTGFESFIHQSRSSVSVATQNVIHDEIVRELGNVTNRGKKVANFSVLRGTQMPAILTECLFIDHPLDSTKLKSSSYLQQIARGHANGIVKAFGLKKKAANGAGAANSGNDPKLVSAIEKLHKAGIISSPDYWLQNAKTGKTVRGDYAAALIQRMTDQFF
ncbi:N-acetylmuramoyl-L-alanine amidase family protein [Bacillus horti]|uniref:N-acetylmuramoyl-L-alanine amidase n=1 Tax=Caldalkalibacillus horti TaxID=77523 RepID=A0ABT9W0M7_9BACI|nr:N-acetylmuramoyl-L-alanine amidase [Bacillus horti]MDQ0166654.1 N-acetylmuramoyl-L-alanine amidase [Bacillus horti]